MSADTRMVLSDSVVSPGDELNIAVFFSCEYAFIKAKETSPLKMATVQAKRILGITESPQLQQDR